MTMDTLRIMPQAFIASDMKRYSFVAVFCIFRSALLLAQYLGPEMSSADIATIMSGLEAFQEHWAIGGECVCVVGDIGRVTV